MPTPIQNSRCRYAGGVAALAVVVRCGDGGVLLMLDLKGARVLVVGLGDTGLSMARWLQRCGAIVRATDSRDSPPQAAVLRRELPQVPLAAGGPPGPPGPQPPGL